MTINLLEKQKLENISLGSTNKKLIPGKSLTVGLSANAPEFKPGSGGLLSANAPEFKPGSGGLLSANAPKFKPGSGGLPSANAPEFKPGSGGLPSANAPEFKPGSGPDIKTRRVFINRVFTNNTSSTCSARHQNTKHNATFIHAKKSFGFGSLIAEIAKNPKPDSKTSKQMQRKIEKSQSLVQALYKLQNQNCGLDSYLLLALFEKKGSFELKKKLFESSDLEIKNQYIIAKYITLAGNEGCFEEAEKAFNIAEKMHILGDFICGPYIKAARDNKRPDQAERAFDIAEANGTITDVICASYIRGAGDNKRPDQAERAFDIAEANGTITDVICASYIRGAGDNKRPDQAKKAFDIAEKMGIINNCICNAYIKAAGDNKWPDQAKRAFDIAEKMGILNPMLHRIYIKAAGDNGCVDEAIRSFNLWKSKRQNNRSDNIHTYGVFIDCLLLNGYVDEANKRFDEVKDSLKLELKEGDGCIDLHRGVNGITVGMALLASIRFIEQNRDKASLSLICGKGTHSVRLCDGISPIKQYLLDNLPHYFPKKQISIGPTGGELEITNL